MTSAPPLDSAPQGGLGVVVFSHFFAPEMGAPAARFLDFGRLLVERGHRVTVVTGFPNYPTGQIPPEYKGKLRQREEIGGVQVLRSWLWASARRSVVSKSLCFGSLALSSSLRALLGKLDADVVVATSPPPTVGLPGFLASRRLGVPMVLDVRDLWPEQLNAAGFIKNKWVVGALSAMERQLYARASTITVVTEGKKTRLAEKGVRPEKVEVVPNGVDLERFDSTRHSIDEMLAAGNVDRDRFLVVYAGVFNPPQGLDVALDSAAWIAQHEPDLARSVQFVLVGDGSERQRLEERTVREDLGDMIRFLGEQRREMIPALLRAAGAILVSLRPRRDTHTVPSKIYESLASRRPVLVSAAGEPSEIISTSGGGLTTPPGDGASLGRAVVRLLRDADLANRCGEQGRAFVEERYDRHRLVVEFEGILQRTVERHK